MYQIDFEKPCKVHFIGIGGISMSGLAEILLSEGFQVSGSDMKDSELCQHLRQAGAQVQIGQRAGSTLSLLYFQDKDYLIKQIGDSRVYCFDGGALRQLTVDQTWCGQMVRKGMLTPEQAQNHRLRHALANALGASEELEIATQTGSAKRGGVFLVCSDGSYNELSARQMEEALKKAPAGQAVQRLLDQVLQGPAPDNASAAVCRLA